jgi:starch phosphorylase
MHALQTFSVIPNLPPSLEPLRFLANNYWFAWNNDLERIFADIDPQLWLESKKNPVWILNHVSQERLNSLAADRLYGERLTLLASSLRN